LLHRRYSLDPPVRGPQLADLKVATSSFSAAAAADERRC